MRVAAIPRTRQVAVAATAVLLVLSGCARPPAAVEQSPVARSGAGTAEPAPVVAEGAPQTTCSDQLATYPPVRADQRSSSRPFGAPLRVAVSNDAPGLGSTDLQTGRLQGMEIDLAHALAEEFTPGTGPELRVLDSATALTELTAGRVDLVVRQLPITCARGEVEYSAPYLQTPITILSRGAQPMTTADLADRRACAVNHTDAMTRTLQTGAIAVPAGSLSTCLVQLRRGEVDAIVGEHVTLAAFAQLDQRTRLSTEKLGTSYFGVAAAPGGVAQIRLTNLVLQERRNSGVWADSYNRWVRPYAGDGSTPQANYGRKP